MFGVAKKGLSPLFGLAISTIKTICLHWHVLEMFRSGEAWISRHASAAISTNACWDPSRGAIRRTLEPRRSGFKHTRGRWLERRPG